MYAWAMIYGGAAAAHVAGPPLHVTDVCLGDDIWRSCCCPCSKSPLPTSLKYAWAMPYGGLAAAHEERPPISTSLKYAWAMIYGGLAAAHEERPPISTSLMYAWAMIYGGLAAAHVAGPPLHVTDVCLGDDLWRSCCCPCSRSPSPRH